MSASVTVIPRLLEGRMVRGVSSSSLSLNLSIPSSSGTTAEAMEESREGISKYKMSYLGNYYVICNILLVAHSSLFGKYLWLTMNTLVAGLPLLTTRNFCPTSTISYALYLFRVFDHLSLMKVEGCSTQAISEALVPWPGQRRPVCGIAIFQFSSFLIFCRAWSDLRWIIITLFF